MRTLVVSPLLKKREQINNWPHVLKIHPSRQVTMNIFKIMRRKGQLFQIVFALSPARCLAGHLNCRQNQRRENSDDRDTDEQLDDRESAS